MHKLLERQLRRIYGSHGGVPEDQHDLIEVVNEAYRQNDSERKLLERSLDLASQELMEANTELRREHKELEVLLARTSASAEASDAAYRDLFESVQDVVFIASPNGRLVDINPAGVKLFGFESKQEMLAVVDLLRISNQKPPVIEVLRRDGFIRDEEFELPRQDGRRITVSATIYAQNDDAGKILSVLGLVRDVTRERALEWQLRQAQKMESIGRLAGGVAHDFNNLLTAIIGYGDLIRQSVDPDDPLSAQLEEIQKAGRRGADLTQQLLAFSRRQVLKPVVVQFNDVITQLENLLHRLISEDVELVTILSPELSPIFADPGQLELVLMNLVINARDAMPHGGRLVIETRNVSVPPDYTEGPPGIEPGEYVLLEILDTGVGMDDQTRDQIFEPFFTTKGSEGTGLGLSTVYGIVRQSGGKIGLSSEPGQGTMFCLYFPIVEGRVARVPVPPPVKVLPSGCETVLLVEDEPVVLTFVEQFLRLQGYQVLVAQDGQEALDLAEQHQGGIDLVISDVVMPRLNGIELCLQLEEIRPDTKVLLMSGYTGERLASDAEKAHLDQSNFLQKPFTADELGWKIREVLEDSGEFPVYSTEIS